MNEKELTEIQREIQRIKSCLDTLIAWISQSSLGVLSHNEARQLIEILQGKR